MPGTKDDAQNKYGRSLLPCPFCGKHPRIDVFTAYAEVRCECEAQPSVRSSVARSVIRVWNTRAGRYASTFAKEKVHQFLAALLKTEGVDPKSVRHLADYIAFHEGKNISHIVRPT